MIFCLTYLLSLFCIITYVKGMGRFSHTTVLCVYLWANAKYPLSLQGPSGWLYFIKQNIINE